MRRLLMATGLLALLLSGPTGALADEPLEGRIVGMLSAIESLPERDAWRALGPESVPILIRIANDAKEPSFRRARALLVLGYFDDPRAVAALELVVSNDMVNESLRRHALLGMSSAAPAQALPHAERALASDDPATRQTGIKVLAASPIPEARSLLERHRAHEQNASLVQQIDAALAPKK